jgi:hypothetical protein
MAAGMNLFGVYWTFVAAQLLLGLAFIATGEVGALILSWITTMLFVLWLTCD